MIRICKFVLCLAGLCCLCVAGCGQSGAVPTLTLQIPTTAVVTWTATLTATKEAATATVMPTDIPTPSLTVTPTPTWSAVETKAFLLDLYENNNGCRLPCWWGFELGKTKWETAKKVLEPIALMIDPLGSSNGLVTYYVEVPHLDPDLYSSSQIYLVRNGVIDEIEINIFQTPYASLKYVFQNYRKPDEIWVSTGRKDEFQSETSFSLITLYNKQGIVIWFDDLFAEIHKEEKNIKGCPQYPNSGIMMKLWQPKEILSFSEIVKYIHLFPKDETFKPLLDATGISVDDYIDMVLGNEFTACLITPLEIWNTP